jgi:hypothetical protein
LTVDRVPLRRWSRNVLRGAAWGGSSSILRLWQLWEPFAMWLWRVRPVSSGSIIQFGVSPYRGPTTVLADGTGIPSGAKIVHLHLDNRRVAAAMREANGNFWSLGPRVKADLDALRDLLGGDDLGDVTALRGVTVLATMARRFGFEVRPLPNNLRWGLVHSLAGLVLASYHGSSGVDLERGIPWPGEIWMSASALRCRGTHSGSPERRRNVESGLRRRKP